MFRTNHPSVFFLGLLLVFNCLFFQACSTNEKKVIPVGPMEHFKQGNALMKRQDYKKAIREYNAAIQLQPGEGIFFYNRGLAQYSLHLFEQSIQSYLQSVRLKKDFSDAWFNLSLAYYQIGETEKAFSAYEKYQELNQ